MMLEILQGTVLLGAVSLAAWTDVRTARIPNSLTVPALAAALLLQAAAGTDALLGSLAVTGVTLAIGTGLFAVRALGGGDVKLLLVMAASLGPAKLADGLLIMALVGLVMAVGTAARRGVLLPMLLNCRDLILFRSRSGAAGGGGGAATVGLGIPYGVAIAIGAAGAWLL